MLTTRRDADERPAQLNATVIAEFRDRGFIAVPHVAPLTELELLRTVFDRLFAERAGRQEGAHFDMLGDDSDKSALALPTIINPINYAPELRHLQVRKNANAIARQLLGPGATNSFEHVILKPAREGGVTPWHQDEAYRVDPGFAYEQVSVWVPLQDVTLENGCMAFVPGSHRLGVLPHRSAGGDSRVHAIECSGEFDHTAAIACPLSAGGATVHHGRTLHFAGSNRSDAPRYAYILIFEIPPEPTLERRDSSWNGRRQTANMLRKRHWRLRGGLVVEAYRNLRSGTWCQPARLRYELRRALRVLRLLIGRS